jgi:hypothetical protein
MKLVSSNHASLMWCVRMVGMEESGLTEQDIRDGKDLVVRAAEKARPATIEEATQIRASSKGAAFLGHHSVEYRIAEDGTVFVIGPGRLEPGVRVVITCYRATYFRRAA